MAMILMSLSVSYKNQNAKLAQAALEGKVAEVERLLAEGIDVNAKAGRRLHGFDGSFQQRSHGGCQKADRRWG